MIGLDILRHQHTTIGRHPQHGSVCNVTGYGFYVSLQIYLTNSSTREYSRCETYLAALGRLVPYLERPCLRSLTPAVSRVPRMM
jgi:hypothetical protein